MGLQYATPPGALHRIMTTHHWPAFYRTLHFGEARRAFGVADTVGTRRGDGVGQIVTWPCPSAAGSGRHVDLFVPPAFLAIDVKAPLIQMVLNVA